ncbi:hypothetical protein ZYGR_0U00320 [Zygosaccharomyces rouxii]|uniref:Protein DML1 n=2 Tax=Zygosaccharomyces rouxii TaxID=4956 RepID=C5DY13_ZYGRC|nr:uncharacterized protein ZYRO0F09438g [Zygosaccharomyces rouxii]KAH9199433.1 Tubulin/FtsZ, GTPase domain-containing protein [Zygosaccharomyces rouxii]GAV50176.1 hypothetical protein ZYGR_0U00320 [Zygosaccharomyces rouxii]CAR28674.1 ZYRO0F09438p [Zygosaccharomyces rouxii]
MHEVISISAGHRCNHLSTQFFNCQEKKLYDEKRYKDNEFSVHLNPSTDKLNQTVSFSPRALIWESKGGNGSLGTYQYVQPEDYFYSDDAKKDKNENVMLTGSKVPRSEYQEALDNSATPIPQLNNEMAKYWSDYSKLIYDPTTFNNLKDWHHDLSKPNLPDFKGLDVHKFGSYELGVQEFDDNYLQEFFDGNLHRQLEQCDTLQGLNLMSSLDSAWSGFSSAMLLELRNELPKTTIFAWNYYKGELKGLNRALLPHWERQMKSSVVCNEEADLVFPLRLDESLSDWEQAGQTVRVLDSVNSLFEQKGEKMQSMTHLQDCVGVSDQTRKFVSSIFENSDYNYSFFDDYPVFRNGHKDPHVFSECLIQRGSTTNSTPNPRTLQTTEFLPSDTVPPQFQSPNSFDLQLSTTEKSRDVFLHWRDVASKYLRSAPDGDELVDNLGTIAATYEYGWYDDEDSGDDDF